MDVYLKLAATAAAALLPVLSWIFFWRARLAEPERVRESVQLFFFGMLSILPLLAFKALTDCHAEFDFLVGIGSTIVAILLLSFLEEAWKSFYFVTGVEVNDERFDRWEDGFEFGVLVGLGFAFAENIVYFYGEFASGGIDPAFWTTYVFRSLVTALAHAMFSGIFGYFYAAAYVDSGWAGMLVPHAKREKPLHNFWRNLGWVLIHPLHFTLFHFFPKKTSRHGHPSGQIILEGFFVVWLLHASFNALLVFTPAGQNLAWLVAPLLFITVWFFVWRWKKI